MCTHGHFKVLYACAKTRRLIIPIAKARTYAAGRRFPGGYAVSLGRAVRADSHTNLLRLTGVLKILKDSRMHTIIEQQLQFNRLLVIRMIM